MDIKEADSEKAVQLLTDQNFSPTQCSSPDFKRHTSPTHSPQATPQLSEHGDNCNNSINLKEEELSKLQPYVFQPLWEQWMRVFRIHPRKRKASPIECSLRHVRISAARLGYDALSYVWGPEVPMHPIWINGCIFYIRDNLYQCLESLPMNKDYWADAICIDQANIEEKNHQVGRMGTIYSRAHSTILWLRFSEEEGRIVKARVEESIAGASSTKRSYDQAWRLVRDNAYWTRLWIVQEVILSYRLVVRFGEEHYDWLYFIKSFNTSGHTLDSDDFRKTLISLLVELKTGRSAERSFRSLLRASSTLRCQDVRDRVFGLLGVTGDFKMRPNYTLTTRRLFEKVMQEYVPTPSSTWAGRDPHKPASVVYTENDNWAFIISLLTALELSSMDLVLMPDLVNEQRKVNFKRCGLVSTQNGKLRYNEETLLPVSCNQGSIAKGDELYHPVFESGGRPTEPIKPHPFIVLRKTSLRQNFLPVRRQDNGIISYRIAGIATYAKRPIRYCFPCDFFTRYPLLHTRTWNAPFDEETENYLALEMSVADICAIRCLTLEAFGGPVIKRRHALELAYGTVKAT